MSDDYSVRLDLEREMVLVRESDDHFYGAWGGGSKAAGGRPSGGRTSVKELLDRFQTPQDIAAVAIAEKSTEFEMLGGEVKAATYAEQVAAVDDVETQMFSNPAMLDDLGVEFTNAAARIGITDDMGPGTPDAVVLLARDTIGGSVAGALAYRPQSFNRRPALFVPIMGSMGIIDGTGSALTRELVLKAAAQKSGITLSPIPEAKPFWQRVGMHPLTPIGGGNSSLWGMTPEEVQTVAARLKGGAP